MKLIDEGFDSKHAESYRLLVQIKPNSFAFTVFHPSKNTFLLLADHVFDGQLSVDLFDNYPELRLPYMGVKVSVETTTTCFTLIPELLFDSNELKTYLSVGNTLPTDATLLHNTLRFSQAVCAYSIPESVKNTIDTVFPKASLYHHGTAFIDGLLFQHRNLSGKNAFINYTDNSFELVIVEDNRLQLYNRFAVQSVTDLLYYTLFALEQLQTPPETTGLILYGTIGNSELELVKKYIPNSSLGNTVPTVTFSKKMDDTTKREFYSLFSLQLCE